jgi:hypothetical protein
MSDASFTKKDFSLLKQRNVDIENNFIDIGKETTSIKKYMDDVNSEVKKTFQKSILERKLDTKNMSALLKKLASSKPYRPSRDELVTWIEFLSLCTEEKIMSSEIKSMNKQFIDSVSWKYGHIKVDPAEESVVVVASDYNSDGKK